LARSQGAARISPDGGAGERGAGVTDVLSIVNVTKRYGQFTAVDGFSLGLSKGQVLGFLGPNGAGKTTTIRMVMSILYPDSGTISVFGHARASEVKDRIGYLPEERGLYRKMSVGETLRYFGRLKGLSGRDLEDRINAGLERIGLSGWKRKKVEALSKGMSQKVQFIATILHEPELVILDEPFSGLDPLNVDLLERLIHELRDAGKTIVFSTHQMNQAERLCDRIVLINRGRKIVEGAVAEVRERFAKPIVAIDADGDLSHLRRLAGVKNAQITAGHARLELENGLAPNDILRAVLERARVQRFAVESPSLQEIFVSLVGESNAQVDSARPQPAVVEAARA
jgi:ABC-2 type transport system ATP-binding protein